MFAMESLHIGILYASMAHTSNSICFPLHNLGSPIDLLEWNDDKGLLYFLGSNLHPIEDVDER